MWVGRPRPVNQIAYFVVYGVKRVLKRHSAVYVCCCIRIREFRLDSYQTYPPRRDAVLCSLAELPDGGLRVVLDDLRQSDTPGHWKNHVFVTFKDYPAGQLDPATLPKEELEAFGHYVLVRLLAINGCLRDTDERSDNDAHLTDQARQNIAALTNEDIASIDEQLFSLCDGQFRKIAYILQAQGDLTRMGCCEVRIRQ